jgi:predicted O-linked N-acetylglucosamine transferase (SPINDLY family)
MAILRAVPDGVLYWVVSDQAARQHLLHEAQARGISAERLVFGESLERGDYLARFAVCDLFLDTWPYNAGTTASDALWMGLPVLTKMGESFASRMAASLLGSLDEATDWSALITTTPEQYVLQAIDLATNPAKLQALKNSLLHNQKSVPLFDTPKFTQRLELAYQAMWQRHQGGMRPEHLWIKAHERHLQTLDSRETQPNPQSLDTAEFDLQV